VSEVERKLNLLKLGFICQPHILIQFLCSQISILRVFLTLPSNKNFLKIRQAVPTATKKFKFKQTRQITCLSMIDGQNKVKNVANKA